MERVRIRFSEDFCGDKTCSLCFADADSKEVLNMQETIADYAMTYEEFVRNRLELLSRYRQELYIPKTYDELRRTAKRRRRFKSNQLAVRVDENSPVAPEVTLESLLTKPFVPKEEIKAQYEGSITPSVEDHTIIIGIDWGYEDETKIKR